MRAIALAAAALLAQPAALMAAPYTPAQWHYLGQFQARDASVDMARLGRDGRLLSAVVSFNYLGADGNPASEATVYWLDCQQYRVTVDSERAYSLLTRTIVNRAAPGSYVEDTASWQVIARDSLSEKLAMAVCPTLTTIGKPAIVPPPPPPRAAQPKDTLSYIDRLQQEVRALSAPLTAPVTIY